MQSGITIQYNCSRYYRRVQEAVERTNELFQEDLFYDNIARQRRFDLATIPSQAIAELMRSTCLNMKVELYYSLSPLHNIDGYDDMNNPSIIHLNLWRIDRSPASLCNTIVHACVHAVNAQINSYYFNQFYFGHGDQFRANKDNTAPYAIGAIAQKMVSDNEAVIIPLEHDPFVLSGEARSVSLTPVSVAV